MFKRISSIIILVIIALSMAVPTFAMSDTDYKKITDANERAKYTWDANKNEWITAVNSPQTIDDINISMGDDNKLNMGTLGKQKQSDVWSNIFTKYKTFIAGISGIAAFTFLIFFIIQFMKLGASSGNPQARTQALQGVLWTGIAAGLLGSCSIFFGFFYSLLL